MQVLFLNSLISSVIGSVVWVPHSLDGEAVGVGVTVVVVVVLLAVVGALVVAVVLLAVVGLLVVGNLIDVVFVVVGVVGNLIDVVFVVVDVVFDPEEVVFGPQSTFSAQSQTRASALKSNPLGHSNLKKFSC